MKDEEGREYSSRELGDGGVDKFSNGCSITSTCVLQIVWTFECLRASEHVCGGKGGRGNVSMREHV